MTLILFIAASIAAFSMLIIPLSSRLRAPILLVFVLIGMLIGENGPVGYEFDDFQLTYNVGTLCLALILLAGGMDTRLSDIRQAALPAALMAGPGVLLTAIGVGAGYTFLLERPLVEGLLFGAVVGSTDAAATFMTLKSGNIALGRRSRRILTVESGINDPMAIFLTLTLVTIVDSGQSLLSADWLSAGLFLGKQLLIGLASGLAVGWTASMLARRISLPHGAYSPFLLAVGLACFTGTMLIGGSGFLAVYLYGLMVANRIRPFPGRTVHFHESLSWLAQIALFVLLGLLVTPSELGPSLLPGLLLTLVLILLARPLAGYLFLLPTGSSFREATYISWLGLKGSVPIFLSILPVITDGPITRDFFNLVFVVVIVSLLIHSLTAAPLARWLRLNETTGL